MVKYKCPTTFKGTKENKVFPANEPFEMIKKRAEEIQDNVKKNYDIELKFERLDASEDNADDKDDKENQSEEK